MSYIQIQKAVVLLLLSLNSYTDIKSREISLLSVLAGSLTGIVLAFTSGGFTPVWLAGLGTGTAACICGLVCGGGIGVGDGLVLLAMGTLLSWRLVLGSFLTALLFSAVYAGILLTFRKAKRKDSFPFIPFLLAGYVIALFLK